MYISKFSTGTILALLALSGMLFLVPLAAPVHAFNAQPPTVQRDYTYACAGGDSCDFNFNLTNPISNSFGITQFSVTMPAGWSATSCSYYNSGGTNYYFDHCIVVGNSVSFTQDSSGAPLPPGASQNLEIQSINFATGTTYPIIGTFTSVVADSSGGGFYAGPSFQLISVDPAVDETVTGLSTTFTAGSAAQSFTVDIGVANAGVPIFMSSTPAGAGGTSGTFAGAGISCLRAWQCMGTTDSSGKLTGTFAPSNKVGSGAGTLVDIVTGGGWFGDGESCIPADCNYYIDSSSITIVTLAGAPNSVGFQLSAAAWPTNGDYLGYQQTSTTTTVGYPAGFKGAVLCVATQQSCTGASPANTAVAVTTQDRFGNAIIFGAGGVTFVGSQAITVQTISGAVFDTATLPSTITCGTTPGYACPAASPANLPFNYFQSSTYGTVGVLTGTITGTYAGSSFSVSGTSGNIFTSSFATGGVFEDTNHVALGANMVSAGKTETVEFALNVVQTGVPVTIGICPHTSCAGTTKGYSGSLTGGGQTVTLNTNSSGIVSTTLTVDTHAGHAAILNASIAQPINANIHNAIAGTSSPAQTTKAGSASTLSVSVGVTSTETPSGITNAYPGETVFVNVITTDAYGNLVNVASLQQVQINLVSNPATLTATSVYIPTGCAMTNETNAGGNPHGYNCTGAQSSFGPIAWTLPSTVGSVATISAQGVLNGASTTSPTVSINIVSKSPTISVTSPKPVNGYLYTNSINVQFKGWANASLGYNGLVNMATLGVKIGSAAWTNNVITAAPKAQWSVVETLPTGLSTVNFNATDAKGNTVVLGTPYNVLVDLSSPTITLVTPAGSVVNGTNPFTANIVASEGDLDASSVSVTVNGTALTAGVTVTGTNNPGSSVTYKVTAVIPSGTWNVQVSASTLAGNTGTSSSEIVHSVVQTNLSFTVVGTPSQTTFANNPDTITAVYKNNLAATQTVTVIAAVKNSGGQQVAFATATATIAAGSTQQIYLSFIGLTPGAHYTVSFYVVSSGGVVVSTTTSTAMTA
jgi:hypothetical protein